MAPNKIKRAFGLPKPNSKPKIRIRSPNHREEHSPTASTSHAMTASFPKEKWKWIGSGKCWRKEGIHTCVCV